MAGPPAIGTLGRAEIETLIGWAADEGWNPGRHDAAAFHAADPGGFLGVFLDGEMVAGISAVAYGQTFGFVGLYICRPDMRGKGYGRMAWDAGLARLAGRTVGLDGVPAQQANYRRMGFAPCYRTLRYSGSLSGSRDSSALHDAGPEHFSRIMAFDRLHFPERRGAFLERWLKPPHRALIHVEDGTVTGYGVVRACRDGFKIGPLFAREEAVARSLFGALASRCRGPVQIDVPETARDFIGFLDQAGFSPGFETCRMYRGPAPEVSAGGIFGITTLELG